jgi:hypothetical protein
MNRALCGVSAGFVALAGVTVVRVHDDAERTILVAGHERGLACHGTMDLTGGIKARSIVEKPRARTGQTAHIQVCDTVRAANRLIDIVAELALIGVAFTERTSLRISLEAKEAALVTRERPAGFQACSLGDHLYSLAGCFTGAAIGDPVRSTNRFVGHGANAVRNTFAADAYRPWAAQLRCLASAGRASILFLFYARRAIEIRAPPFIQRLAQWKLTSVEASQGDFVWVTVTTRFLMDNQDEILPTVYRLILHAVFFTIQGLDEDTLLKLARIGPWTIERHIGGRRPPNGLEYQLDHGLRWGIEGIGEKRAFREITLSGFPEMEGPEVDNLRLHLAVDDGPVDLSTVLRAGDSNPNQGEQSQNDCRVFEPHGRYSRG